MANKSCKSSSFTKSYTYYQIFLAIITLTFIIYSILSKVF